jgi:hypothetical protein
MGEQEYKNLEDQVGELQTTVEDQASEMKIIEVRREHLGYPENISFISHLDGHCYMQRLYHIRFQTTDKLDTHRESF